LNLSPEQLDYLRRGRIARLGTLNEDKTVHLVPVVFANVEERIYFVIDQKTKHQGKRLRRIKNILETKKATLLVDHYSEKWESLSYLLLYCNAKVLAAESALKERNLATRKLKEKYPQYRNIGYFPEDIETAVFVRLDPQKAVFWQNLRRSLV